MPQVTLQNGEIVKLTEKQFLFVNEYLSNGQNALQAAIKSGYAKPEVQSSRLLDNVRIASIIQDKTQELVEKVQEQTEIRFEDWVNQYASIAFSDITEFFDTHDIKLESGRSNNIFLVKDVKSLPKHIRVCIQEITPTAQGYKIKLHDKLKALDRVGEIMGWLNKDSGSLPNAPKTLSQTFININNTFGIGATAQKMIEIQEGDGGE